MRLCGHRELAMIGVGLAVSDSLSSLNRPQKALSGRPSSWPWNGIVLTTCSSSVGPDPRQRRWSAMWLVPLQPQAGSRLTWGQNRPEPVVVDPVVRVDVVADRYSAALRIVKPTAAANNAGRARTRPSRVSLCSLFISTIPVPSPLPHIPNHIIQPIPVGSI